MNKETKTKEDVALKNNDMRELNPDEMDKVSGGRKIEFRIVDTDSSKEFQDTRKNPFD